MENEELVISHLYKDAGDWHVQTNSEHCDGVAELTASFTKEFGYESWGYMLGQLHDRGKERKGFQSYIRRTSGYDESTTSSDLHHHGYIGAIVVHKLKAYDALGWLSNPIAGHHRGLYDMDDLKGNVLSKVLPPDVDDEIPEVKLSLPSVRPNETDASHIGRMLFSCLVDADRLDTERFMKPVEYGKRGKSKSLEELNDSVNAYLDRFKQKKPTSINIIRCLIQECCRQSAGLNPGFFELTVPTGGGKTIASVLWAINHALTHGKKRIIISIPFTSIIVQTAAVLREIFGEENVLEHHSVISESEQRSAKGGCKYESEGIDETQLATENWDAPIIVTTNVQLFESMFSHRPGVCRKLHSLCNSVVILDEVQNLPLSLLQPITEALQSYVKLFGVSFLFCTASQPVLDGSWKGNSNASFFGIERKKIREIIPQSMALHKRMRRVKLEFDQNSVDYDTIAERISAIDKALCVVNTRRTAFEIYSRLSEDKGNKYHLSRQMCQAHILNTINQIKKLLTEGESVTVVSTQLIEAGVDIDFPAVFRELAGLDSILQAAGRCNREGKLNLGTTHIFALADAHMADSLKESCYVMRDMVSCNPTAEWFSPEMMRKYYETLYKRVSSYDKPGISEMLVKDKGRECQYETASKKFKMIDNTGKDVIVNYGEAESLIARLREQGLSKGLSRELGRYSVTVNNRTFDELRRNGLIEEVAAGVFFIPLAAQYDEMTGLKTNNEYLEQTFVI